jgi:hypothetical protein
MVLTAIVDCLVSTELDHLIQTFERDGIRCLSSDLSLDALHDDIRKYAAQPIVIYGASSLEVPCDDCPRLWLCCGPELDTEHDVQHATLLLGGTDAAAAAGLDQHVLRRDRALRSNCKFVSYIDMMSFIANALAKQCVHSMNIGNKAADIILRHVTKTEYS